MKESNSARERWNQRYANSELIWSSGPNETIAREAGTLVPGRALDLGCGEGRNAIYLAEQGWRVTAIDFSETGIGKARQIAERRNVKVDWVIDDITSWLPDGTFDLVIVAFLHTDRASREQWLQSATDCVAPDGNLFYIGHDPSNIEHGVGGPQDSDVLPTVGEIVGQLDGFIVENASVITRSVDAEPGHGMETAGTAMDAWIRARRRDG